MSVSNDSPYNISPTTKIVDTASASVTYVGEAAIATATSAGSWRVYKIGTSGNVVTITYADGNSNFDNIWDNRAALVYS